MLRKAERTSAPPVLDALSPQAGFERALAAALGDDLNAPTDKNAPEFWGGMDQASDPTLPAGCISLASVCDAPTELDRRLAQCGVVDTDSDAEMLRNSLHVGQRLVSKSGGLWRWDGYVRKSDAPLSQAEQLEQRNRLEAAQTALPDAEAQHNEAQTQLASVRLRRQECDQALKGLRQAVSGLQKTRNDLNSKLFRAQQEKERAALKRETLEASVTATEEQYDELASAINSLVTVDAADDEVGIQDTLQTLRAKIAALRDDERQARANLDDLQRNRDRIEGRRRGLERDIREWQKRSETTNARIEALRKSRSETREKLEAAKSQPEALSEQIDTLAFELKGLEKARQEAADAHAEADTKARETERLARDAKEAATKAREATASSTAKLETAQERLKDAIELASGQFQRQPEGLLSLAESQLDGEDWSEAGTKDIENEVGGLKHELGSLGSVNQDAERDAEELAARLGSQEEEKADLTAAIAKLREGVNALNNEGRDRLMAAFEKVNENFQSLFTTLFNGGQAELRLVDADDPLMAGLEIYAQPPGKRVTSLNLMSGGEQALTAAALIFAVFLSNPAPICVLDEVDAPLDDVNVDRFCRLLDEMRRRTATRFVAITHNPVTMSRMDRLFGVTMQEQGVSRIVSVDLGTAEQLVAAE